MFCIARLSSSQPTQPETGQTYLCFPKKPPPKTGEWSVTSLRFAKNGFHHNFHPCIELRHNDEEQQPQDVHHDEQILRINEILKSTRDFFQKKMS